MPKNRHPQPWFRPSRNTYYVTVAGRQHNLGTADEQEAWKQFHLLVAELESHQDRPGDNRHVGSSSELTVAGVFALFAEWVEKNRSPKSYDWYRRYLDSFLKTIEPNMPIGKLKKHHVTGWLAMNPHWGKSGKRGAIVSVKRAVSWAVEEEYVDTQPLAKLRSPNPPRRTTILTPDQRKWIVAEASDQEFRDLLTLVEETGVRPLEVRTVEARHVDLDNGLWVFPPDEHKTGEKTGEPRVVYLTPTSLQITRRLVAKYPEGPICRNSRGESWTANSIRLRFQRLRKRLSDKLPADLCAYHYRHTFATEALQNGVDPITLATLMGHKDATMVSKVYQHVAQKVDHMKEAAQRATGRGNAS